MEISAQASYNSHRSIFEAILQECSDRERPHEEDAPVQTNLPVDNSIFKVEHIQMDDKVWSWMEEAHEGLLDEKDSGMEDLTMQFKRVKSLREEQETKLAEFLREDSRKPQGSLGSPVKQSQSVSPRKGKRIDKSWRGRWADSP